MTLRETLNAIASERLLILDGAMGSMIQGLRLSEADFRGPRFASHPAPLLGCNDLLCLTRPEAIRGIHEAYLEAGADIIETCSFNATALSLGDFGIGGLACEISAAAARLARQAADAFSTPEKRRFVAGSMGPTAKSASISPDIDNPERRSVYWDELEASYYDNARGLIDGGADILLIETVFDTLNAKAAIFAAKRLMAERGIDIPLWISATVNDSAGRLLSGQTIRAFCVSVLHADPWALGLNCSFGAEKLLAHVRELAGFVPCLASAHPNAGMPNEEGRYDESPRSMADHVEEYLGPGLVNIIGGCCGTTPAHIAAIAERARGYGPRRVPGPLKGTFLAGLDALAAGRERGLTAIGERTNVAGSKKFLRLVKEENYREAMGIARDMIEKGAAVIDICMDDALLDAEKTMVRFLRLTLSDPDIAEVPFMIDSSRWNVIEEALKCIQGKALVNSISLKEGEEEFLRRARRVRLYGAAVVVMLFDEKGQAASFERKIEIARRSYNLLRAAGFPPEDIVFDPNILAIATGMDEHDALALEFIRACRWIAENCPGVQISGGLSNLSFSFRGNDTIRQAMHAVFLKHAVDAGLSMAIVNPSSLIACDGIDEDLRRVVEDLILRPASGAAERLLAAAEKITPTARPEAAALSRSPAGPEERILEAMVKGNDDRIEEDLLELRPKYGRSLDIVEKVLMRGMKEVGDRFGEGKMFLPQVIRSARVMKKAVTVLEPFIEQEKAAASERAGNGGAAGTAAEGGPATGAGAGTAEVAGSSATGGTTVLLATVKGDVHDIGKNIVGVVLGCNGYRIRDLGVMIPAEEIADAAEKEGAGIVGLSGLISPSLDQMINTARVMEGRGLKIPLLIGGAAASLAHTGLRIAPEYSGPVVYVPDAGRSAEAIRSLLSPVERPSFLEELEQKYQNAVRLHNSLQTRVELLSLEAARKNKIPMVNHIPMKRPIRASFEFINYSVERVIPFIQWQGIIDAWELRNHQPAADERDRIVEDAKALLKKVVDEKTLSLRGIIGFFPAGSSGDDVLLYDPAAAKRKNRPVLARFSFLRNQEKKRSGAYNPCLADFIAPGPDGGWIGLFALSAGFGLEEAAAEYRRRGDDYGAILLATLANALAEALSEEAHLRVRRAFWPRRREEPKGIRPAFGYPACPDHGDKRIVFDLLQVRERCGLELTESAMIVPAASVCGMYIEHPGAYYFGIGPVGDDQLADWAARKGIGIEEARQRTGRI
ncbi:MAG: methionine synthase [Treponema sp.]|jgi:5-methyltetrahydrofolate--homocysteine methyltransferase|nr:methionine synthase [Treponema sp.]